MSTTRANEMSDRKREAKRWLVPAVCLVAAAGYAIVFLADHKPMLALTCAGIMVVYGLVLVVFSRRSEMIAMLREDATDERRAAITTKAAATTAHIVIVLAVIMLFVQLGRGQSPGPWGVICAVAGLGFIVSLAYHSRRS